MSPSVQVSRTPARRIWWRTAAASVREAPRQEIAGCVQVYGDLPVAAMMAGRAWPDFGDRSGRSGWGLGEVAHLPERSRDDFRGLIGR